MNRMASREYEQELLQKLYDAGISNKEIVGHLLGWMSSDDSCEALENMCTDYDLSEEEDD